MVRNNCQPTFAYFVRISHFPFDVCLHLGQNACERECLRVGFGADRDIDSSTRGFFSFCRCPSRDEERTASLFGFGSTPGAHLAKTREIARAKSSPHDPERLDWENWRRQPLSANFLFRSIHRRKFNPCRKWHNLFPTWHFYKNHVLIFISVCLVFISRMLKWTKL